MKTGADYAAAALRRNPRLFGGGKRITIGPEELLRQLADAYDAGRDDSIAELRAKTASLHPPPGFDELFGKLRS